VATACALALVAASLASAQVSANRMVWPALIASLAVIAAAGAWRWPERWRAHPARRLAAVAALTLAMVAAFVDVATMKAESTQAPPPSIGRSVAEDPRLAIWAEVRDRIAERPWVGHGYGKEILGASLAARLGDPTLTHAHNAFASVWLETGAIGLVLFVAVLAAAAWRFVGYARSRDDALSLAGVVGLAILAGMIVKNLPDDFFVRTNARYLWTTLALLVAFGERRLRTGSQKTPAEPRA
jgi:O-antigen ligase